MPFSDESRHVSLSLSDLDRLCPVAKALSSPMRVRMIALLSTRSMNVNELAEASCPFPRQPSTCASLRKSA